ncbi:AAA family ATPase [Nostocoides sp. F2B08]|uniref:AAA family ATPase n=1 Tax=Nostocoides sp. F2B08 TaxID=2653936 RepID=UPI00126374E5|nr:adenylate/guanylate cyclase domain-containing protein [Tetrasphaera sp. F2B08]KAB7741852.1 AAA family ATPase [Tetrasphaera sp. F2B08]
MTDLRRHVPPLTLTWDDECPGALWRVVDGTLVFADVSGFTALTEKLSRRGRIGAEEIVETLNRVFGPMLRIAAARGGELLKFGGDALLFLFRGDDHPEQACDAAVEMRSALRAAAAVPTSVGRLSLSMSVGVHSGDIHLFLVGAPTRELLILGPGATATADAEKAADAGQIVVSPATAYRIGSNATRDRGDGQLLLRRRVAHTDPPGATPLPAADPTLLRTLFPHALGDYLAPAIPDPEHRLSCIAFIRFSGTDALLAGPGPDVLAACLHRTVSLVEEALEPEGVSLLATDLDSDGGKFFLGSGIPTAFEDNEGRMLRALKRIADADSPLPLQLGTNRGHVFAAEVGIPERGAYTGMGDTTNTAARIMAKAPPGCLYAHPAVLEHSRTLFAVTPAGPFPMKGKAVPLLVYDVGEEIGTRDESAPGSRLPFLGRDEELATATAELTHALGGAGGVVTIAGGTGMGKSRFVREVLDTIDRDHLIVLRAEPYGSASAYRMLRDPLRTLLGIERGDPESMGRALRAGLDRVAPDLLPWAPLLADVAQVDVPSTPEVDELDPRYRPDRLADAVIRLLETAMPGRVVIAVEEAHWADAASAALLVRIAAAVVERPWAVVAIRRSEDGGFDPDGGVRIDLHPLSDDVIERLVIAATEATPLRPQEIAAVVGRAEGNPLFVDEVTRVAVGAGSLDSLPESVGAALLTQIDALLPHHRRILRYCAVLGRSFRTEILRLVLEADGIDLTDRDLGDLSAFLEADGDVRMRFRNSLVRDAAYEGLAYRIRARLHRTAAETLERISTDLDADAPTLALHFWRAGDSERTWTYARRAGAEARRAYANVDAAELYERAIEVSRRVDGVTDADRAQLYALLGELRELAGVLDGSIEAYRRAAALTADPVGRALVLAKRARVHQRAGAPRTALRVVTQARRLLDGADGAEAAAVMVRLDNLIALIRLGQEKAREAQQWATRAAEGARRIDDLDNLGSALLASGHALWQLGLPGPGDRIQEALEIYEQCADLHGQAVARTNLGVLAFGAGRWSEALDWYRSSRDVALRAGMDFQAAEADLNIAEILIHQGDLDEAEEVLRGAVRVLRASGMPLVALFGDLLLARLVLRRGDLEDADRTAAQVVEQSTDLGSPLNAAEALLVRAQVALEQGQAVAALGLVDAADVAAGEEVVAVAAQAQLVRGGALLRLGRRDEALVAIDAGLESARAQELLYEEARLLEVRAALVDGSPDEARAHELLAEMGVRA